MRHSTPEEKRICNREGQLLIKVACALELPSVKPVTGEGEHPVLGGGYFFRFAGLPFGNNLASHSTSMLSVIQVNYFFLLCVLF